MLRVLCCCHIADSDLYISLVDLYHDTQKRKMEEQANEIQSPMSSVTTSFSLPVKKKKYKKIGEETWKLLCVATAR